MFAAYLKNESGATAIEYALIAALIAISIISSASLVSGSVNTTFGKATTALS